MRHLTKWLPVVGALIATPALAQHDGHRMPADTTAHPMMMPGMPGMPHAPARPDTTGGLMPIMPDPSGAMRHDGHAAPGMPDLPTAPGAPMGMMGDMEMGHGEMTSTVLVTVPMTREGSGTSWQPDETPMYGAMHQAGPFEIMLHGSVFASYSAQNVGREANQRGDDALDFPTWFMAMASTKLGHDTQLGLRGMISLDPPLVGGEGYPLLFQTGETNKGVPLVDRQHPHDLFSELSVTLSHRFAPAVGGFLYFGLPGEPALGPPAFMHRISAQHNPNASLGHHWQDATHITFGVATAGFQLGPAQIEASLFTGREPDENRYNFDRPKFDSYAFRFSVNPTAQTAVQVSHGFLKSPESVEPEVDERRTTGSLLYSSRVGAHGAWTSAAVYGVNDHLNGSKLSQSVLLESDLDLPIGAVYGRAEYVEKSAQDLVLPSANFIPLPQGGATDAPQNETQYGIGAFTLGLAREVGRVGGIRLEIGAEATLYRVPSGLNGAYGNAPVSVQAYLRLSPTQMMHQMGGMMHGMMPGM